MRMIKSNEYFIFDNEQCSGLKSLLYRLVSFGKSIYYKAKLIMSKPNVISKKYNVAICAIFKNEGPYLKEWLEFNHIVGVDHFYLYNNNSEDDYQIVLQPYIDNGLVTLIQWPYNQKQMECYMSCIENYSKETKWLGFIDIDEFIVPKDVDSIYSFLKPFEKKAGSVNIYWKIFGTSGLLERDLTSLVSEDFVVCWPKYMNLGKCFYNTAYDFNEKSTHSSQLHHRFWANYKGVDIPPVNVFGHICVGDRHIADNNDFPIQINHYFTKSYKEYAMKRAKGDVYFKINPHDEKYFYEHEMKCTSTDYSAYKYLVKLKSKLGSEHDEI